MAFGREVVGPGRIEMGSREAKATEGGPMPMVPEPDIADAVAEEGRVVMQMPLKKRMGKMPWRGMKEGPVGDEGAGVAAEIFKRDGRDRSAGLGHVVCVWKLPERHEGRKPAAGERYMKKISVPGVGGGVGAWF